MEAAQAARFFWQLASSDERISNKFRSVCRENAKKLNKACNSAVLRKIPT
jgi:hypothetical protein